MIGCKKSCPSRIIELEYDMLLGRPNVCGNDFQVFSHIPFTVCCIMTLRIRGESGLTLRENDELKKSE